MSPQSAKPAPKWLLPALLAGAALLLAYTTGRALAVALTFDEAWTLTGYARTPWADILGFKYVTANNHLANSLLVKASTGLLGDSPFAIRLPNLLAHVAYLGFSIAISRRLGHPFWAILGFLFLNVHPYLLDFFALGRGYGLGLAMALGALHHMLSYRERALLRHAAWNALFAGLGVVCNLSALHLFVANAGLMGLLALSHARAAGVPLWPSVQRVGLHIGPLLLVAVLLYLGLAGPVRALVAANELYYGGTSGFWSDTVFSLCHATLYKVDYWRHDVAALQGFCLAALVGMFVAFCIEASERREDLRGSMGLVPLLLMGCVAFTVTLQHYLLGSPFLIYRTALFLLPLFGLGLVCLLRYLAQHFAMRGGVAAGGAFLGICLLANGVAAANWTHASEWPADADTPRMLADLERDRKALGHEGTLRLAVSWELRPVVNYYLERLGLAHIPACTQQGCLPGMDYYFVLGDGGSCKVPPADRPFGERQGHPLVQSYPVSGAALWRGADFGKAD